MRERNPSASKLSIGPVPDRPVISDSQQASDELPTGLTMPMPVTTTRRLDVFIDLAVRAVVAKVENLRIQTSGRLLPLQYAQNVFRRQLRHPSTSRLAGAGDVRRYQNARPVQDRMLSRQWLGIGHVERGAPDFTRVDCEGERVKVDDRTA